MLAGHPRGAPLETLPRVPQVLGVCKDPPGCLGWARPTTARPGRCLHLCPVLAAKGRSSIPQYFPSKQWLRSPRQVVSALAGPQSAHREGCGRGGGPGLANVLRTQRGEWAARVALRSPLLPRRQHLARAHSAHSAPNPGLGPAPCPGPASKRGSPPARGGTSAQRMRRAQGAHAQGAERACALAARRHCCSAGRVAVGPEAAMGQGAAAVPGAG